MVDDIGEQLATKKTKRNNQYIRETRSPDRHYSPQRDSSPARSPVRVSSPYRSPMRRSPSKSPVRRFSPLRSPERNSSPHGDIGSPVISSRISSPSKESDSRSSSRVSSPIYPRAESPVRDQSWGSRLSKLKVKIIAHKQRFYIKKKENSFKRQTKVHVKELQGTRKGCCLKRVVEIERKLNYFFSCRKDVIITVLMRVLHQLPLENSRKTNRLIYLVVR